MIIFSLKCFDKCQSLNRLHYNIINFPNWTHMQTIFLEKILISIAWSTRYKLIWNKFSMEYRVVSFSIFFFFHFFFFLLLLLFFFFFFFVNWFVTCCVAGVVLSIAVLVIVLSVSSVLLWLHLHPEDEAVTAAFFLTLCDKMQQMCHNFVPTANLEEEDWFHHKMLLLCVEYNVSI